MNNDYQAVKKYEQMMAALSQGKNYGNITPEYLEHFSTAQLKEMAQAPYYYNITFHDSSSGSSNNNTTYYEPVSTSNNNYGLGYAYASDYVKMLKDAQQAQLKARAQALEDEATRLAAGKADIDAQADEARKDIYTNARLSAIGNNEALANLGLAGNLYEQPKSGYSETSRISEDNALRSGLAGVEEERIRAKNEVDLAISKLRSEGEKEKADLVAKHAQDLINLMMRQIV